MVVPATVSEDIRNATVNVLINETPLPQEAMHDLLAVTVEEDVDALGMFTLRLSDWDMDRRRVQWMDHALFTEGNAVEIQIGYEGDARLTTLMAGEITGLEPEFTVQSSPTLTVRGYDRRHRLARGHKTRAFVLMKDSDIARQIAADAGFRPQVEDTQVQLEYVLQHNQTDLAFLRERARRLGCEVVVEDKTLHVRRPPANQPAAVTLSVDEDLIEFLPRLTAMTQVDQMEVRGWDLKHKKVITGTANSTPGMSGTNTGPRAARSAFGSARSAGVQRPVFTQDEADRMAQGQFDEMALSYISGDGICTGRADVRAGAVVRIDGVGRRFSGLYYVTSTTHTLTAGEGYRTTFTVRRNAT
jgi:phage protein D